MMTVIVKWFTNAKARVQLPGNPDSAGVDADHSRITAPGLPGQFIQLPRHTVDNGADVIQIALACLVVSSQFCRMIFAAMASIPSLFFPGISRCSALAACVLRRSSIPYTGSWKRVSSSLAKPRAAREVAESLPSACRGRPTTREPGVHSATSLLILSQSGLPPWLSRVHSAVAVPVTSWPTAIPMRRFP